MENNNSISSFDRTILLSIFTGTYFIAAFAALCFAPLLPFIQEDLFINKASLGFFVSSLYLGAIAAGFPSGWVADKWGIPVTITIGLVLQGLCLFIVALIPSFFWMIIVIFIAGVGFGAVNPATSKGIITWFQSDWRATAMAIKQMGFTAGTMGVAAVLPAVAEVVGWRNSVIIVALMVTICGIITYFAYPGSITKKSKPDILTSSVNKQGGYVSPWKNKTILIWSFLCIFYAFVQISGTVYLAVFMVDYFSYSKVMAGMFLSITQGGGALGRVVWGRISDVYFADSRDKELILLGFIAAATCIVLGLLPSDANTILIGIVAAVFGFTAIGYNALFLTLIGEIAGPDQAGQAIGVSVTIAYIGIVIGPIIFGMGIDYIGYQKSWISMGCMLAVVMLFMIIFSRRQHAAKKTKAGH